MNLSAVSSHSHRFSLRDGVRAVLENAQFRVSSISDGENQSFPVPCDFYAELNQKRFVVKCCQNPESFEVSDLRALVDFCRKGEFGNVMVIGDGGFSASLLVAAKELSVQVTDRERYHQALIKLPATAFNPPVAPKMSGEAHSLPPSVPSKKKKRGISPVMVGRVVMFIGFLMVIVMGGSTALERITPHLTARFSPAPPPSKPLDELVDLAMAEMIESSGKATPVFDKNGELETMVLGSAAPEAHTLEELQVHLNPSFRIGSSKVFVADDSETLLAQIKKWPPLVDPEVKGDFGNVAVTVSQGKVWAWVYEGTQLSPRQQLDEALTKGGVFTLKCQHCQDESSCRLTPHAKCLVTPTCQRCGLVAHFFGPDTDGNFRRACDFLTGFKIPKADVLRHRPAYPAQFTAKEDVLAHWKAILDRCDYEFDSTGRGRLGRDIWKLPEQTWEERLGDCEDTTILLTDALISAGYEARVAFGYWHGEGHAWCVVMVDGKQRILETTMVHTGAVSLRSILKVGSDYVAIGMFDRDSIYLRRNAANLSTLDYFSDSYWMALKENEKEKADSIAIQTAKE